MTALSVSAPSAGGILNNVPDVPSLDAVWAAVQRWASRLAGAHALGAAPSPASVVHDRAS
jgi:hypothetical protein